MRSMLSHRALAKSHPQRQVAGQLGTMSSAVRKRVIRKGTYPGALDAWERA